MSPLVRWGGGAALALVAALTLGTVAALALRAEPGRGLGPAEWAALRFTLVQALLSAALSCAAAVPAARALARRRFPGRGALVALLGAPFLLPAIVAVFGIVAIWGRAGLASRGLEAVGLPGLDVYGLVGVVLAHVFFNVALVARLLLQGWLAIPAETFRLAAQLGFGPREVFRRIELPMLRSVLPGAFVLVFLLCMTSFAVALTLGGGPRATTVELAIYQALRFDFDLGRAAWLALIQFALCGGVALVALRLSADAGFEAGVSGAVERWDADRPELRALDAGVLLALALFLGLPLGAVAAKGAAALAAGLPSSVWAGGGAEPRRRAGLGGAGDRARAGAGRARRRAAGAGRRLARRGGGADDARRLAVRDRHRALHPAVSARRPVHARAAGDRDGQRGDGAALRAPGAAAGAGRGAAQPTGGWPRASGCAAGPGSGWSPGRGCGGRWGSRPGWRRRSAWATSG